MAISSVLVNVTDVDRAIDFYTRFLDTRLVERTPDGALLDAVTATIRLVRLSDPSASTWEGDDIQAGFRHIGFKVGDLDARVAALHEAGVRFHLEPIHAEGDVRITFFYDPDGTLVELVEGPLRYHEVYDQAQVDADWGLGTPDRPRFDHVAETVADAHTTHEYYKHLGFTLMGGIHQPSDPRGFEITYVRGGDTVLEIFEFTEAEVAPRAPQLDAPGFAAMQLDADSAGSVPSSATALGSRYGLTLTADTDGLVAGTAKE